MLQALNISKSFNGNKVLKEIDIHVEKGKITTIIGPSGCGKSALVRALSLLDPPTLGTIIIDDRQYVFPQKNNDNPSLPWPKLTVVFQELFLWPHMTLRQNITFPIRKQLNPDMKRYIDELIEQFEMSEFIDRYSNEVSSGERQRVALVRALVLRPDYIILDEITSALDVEQINSVLSCLQSLRKEDIGILLVTHLIGFARRVADHIVFIDDGRVLESGGKEVLDAPNSDRARRFLSAIEAAT